MVVQCCYGKKADGKWRMCIDFTNLNKTCLKDSFPLPIIDQLVDATTRHELLSFMNGYLGYNQIKMYKPDKEKTSVVTSQGLYCYNAMPFGMKNVGAEGVYITRAEVIDNLGRLITSIS